MKKDEKTKELKGLGGWLILLGIGIVFCPFLMLFELVPLYQEIFQPETWEILTTPGTEAYHPYWSPYLTAELLINAFLILASFYMMYLFFRKKKIFPIFFIVLVTFSIIFVLVDAAAIQLILPDEPIFDEDTVKELTRTILTALIWFPYLLISKRVKATFVN